ncbi:MAG: helix-turn-helix domain-containing protein [Lachnospiraceae bacterium]|nr:helix-turn-helix domain-containing protein [Lachnospiraceae bacterium]
MDKAMTDLLKVITEEERNILDNDNRISSDIYFEDGSYIIDSKKLLEKGRLIEIRPHARFAHFPKHSHNYVELVYMCSGSTTHILNDSDTITLKTGELLFLNQNASQEILPAGEDDIALNFIILPEFFERVLSMLSNETVLKDFLISCLTGSNDYSYLYFKVGDVPPIQNLIENMIWSLINKHSETVVNTINQTTMALLIMNLSAYGAAANAGVSDQYEQSTVYSVMQYIDAHYKHGTLAAISEELTLPTYTVSRMLKKYTKKSFKELLQERKLKQAAYLLSNTTMSVEAIYNYIGYENSSYFYRCFRSLYGCSPREWRSKLIQ